MYRWFLLPATSPFRLIRPMPQLGLQTSAICAVLVVITSGMARSQDLFPRFVFHALDSALSSIAMERTDLAMRWDAVGDDPHRLRVIKQMFGDPLGSFRMADSLANTALRDPERPTELFEYACALLDMDPSTVVTTRGLPTDSDIRLAIGIHTDTLDFTTSILLRRFLALVVATDAATVSNRGTIRQDQLARIVDYCDSLMLQSEENEDASLVEMRLAERYGIERNKQHFNLDLKGVNFGRLATPGITQFLMALDMAQGMEKEVHRYRDTIKTRIWKTPLGLVALGGGGDDYYEGDFFLIVDLGGNDIYRASARSKRQAFDQPVNLIIDFSGDDLYVGGDYVFGGSLFGASTLIDLKGNDNYSVGNFGLGSGFFGTSVLYDFEGRDKYSGGTCVQGSGAFGIGLLIDVSGNDLYHAHLTSQGYGYTRGLGAIVEGSGNDQYIANSPYTDILRYDDHFETFCQGSALGARPIASAGIGLIAEGGGSDLYSADIFGQGVGYWFGLGAIVDRTGNDTYSAFQYAQGSGVHLAFGVLIDTSGNDNYLSHGVSQGCGHDIAFGGLYDAHGDDNYVVESLSLGGGNADAISLFVDAGGEDGYLARRDNTLGYSDLRREYGMIGIFLDLERKDFYGTSRGGNDSLWTGSYYGVGIDGELRPKDSGATASSGTTPQKTPQEIEAELAQDIPTLFIQASAAPQKYQYLVEPARKRLVEMADSSLPYLLRMLNTESPREALALGIILPRIGIKARSHLIDTVVFGEITRVGRAIYALGEMKDTLAAAAIARRLIDSAVSWRLRGVAGEAILKIRSRDIMPQLQVAMNDTVELIRGYATRAFLMVADSAEIIDALKMLGDKSQIVRYQFQLALQRRPVDSVPGAIIAAYLASSKGVAHMLMLPLVRSITAPAWRALALREMFERTDTRIRREGIGTAARWDDSVSAEALRTQRSRERDVDLQREIDRILSLHGRIPSRSGDTVQRRTDSGAAKTKNPKKVKKANNANSRQTLPKSRRKHH